MPSTLPLDVAGRNLKGRIEQLQQGESITLLDADGQPLALLVSLKTAAREPVKDWAVAMKALAEEIDAAWQGKASAIETLSAMRR